MMGNLAAEIGIAVVSVAALLLGTLMVVARLTPGTPTQRPAEPDYEDGSPR